MKKLVFLLFIANTLISFGNLASCQNSNDSIAGDLKKIATDIHIMKRLQISGYIQPQWQHIDSAGAPSYAGGDFTNGSQGDYNNRFTIRRGRFKFTYDVENIRFLMNIDVTEKGIAMRETYVRITDPWIKMFSVAVGCLNIPVGFEVTYSSTERESPERVRYNQILFPTERDLGIFANISFPVNSKLQGLKIDASVINGSSGVNPEFDSNKDFTGRIQYARIAKYHSLTYALGSSFYTGGYSAGKEGEYFWTTLAGGEKGFMYSADTTDLNRKAVRKYISADAQFSIGTQAGVTIIRAEYITGQQPGTAFGSKSPSEMPTSSVYHRNFNGAYFYFIQSIGKSKFQAVLKYDWYDPNTKTSGNDIGKPGTNTNLGDIRFDTFGFGMNYFMTTNVKLVAYYDWVKNESTLVSGYSQDIKDNVITIRLQAKF